MGTFIVTDNSSGKKYKVAGNDVTAANAQSYAETQLGFKLGQPAQPAAGNPVAPKPLAAPAVPPNAIQKFERYAGNPDQIGAGKLVKGPIGPAGIVPNILQDTNEGAKLVKSGIADTKKGHYLKGPVKAALGGLEFGGASVSGTWRAMASDPLRELTGSPMLGDVADLLAPTGIAKKTGVGKKVVDAAEDIAKNSPTLRKWGTEVFSPDKLNKVTEKVSSILDQSRGMRKQNGAKAVAGLEDLRPIVDKMTDPERENMIHYIEGDKTIKLAPEQQKVADRLKHVYEWYRYQFEAHPMTDKASMKDNYFPHDWEQPQKADKFIEGHFAKQGSGKNLKARKLPTLREGQKAGLKLRTTDPIDTTVRYVKNADSYLHWADTIHALRDKGIAKYFANPKKVPKDWEKINGRFSTKDFRYVDKKTGDAKVISHQLYAPKSVAQTLNRYTSKSFTGKTGEVMEKIQHASNALTNAKMLGGVSYHTLAITTMAIASSVKNATSQLMKGDFKGAAQSLGGTLKTIASKTGSEYTDAYLGKTRLPPEKQKILDAMVHADAVQQRAPDYMMTGRGRSAFSAAQRKLKGIESSFTGAVKKDLAALYKDKKTMGKINETIGYVGDTLAGPVFDKWIPKVKTGVVAEAMETWNKAHPKATADELREHAREVSSMVDRHFGEMNRDKIFWSNQAKQLAGLGFLSYAWVTGTISGMARGAASFGKTALRGDELTEEGKMLIGTIMTNATLASMYQYIKTGKGPSEPKDLVFPQTGGSKYHAPERAVLPGHAQQVYQYTHDPIQELTNELSPLLSTGYSVMRGKDYFGRPQDRGALAVEGLTPIPAQILLNREKGTGISGLESLAGIRPANQAITNPARAAARDEYDEQQADKARAKQTKKRQ